MNGKSPCAEMSAPTAIDFFCGAGGLSLGLVRAGFAVVAAYDLDSDAVSTYTRNIGPHCFPADVTDLSAEDALQTAKAAPGETSLVAGGPPCQGFSVQRRNGEGDARNSLPLEFARLIKGIRPAFFLFENVPGIRNRHGQKILQAFVEDMTDAQYVCHAAMLDAVNFGVPQFRKRLFMIGEHSPSGETWFRFPDPSTTESDQQVTVGAALAGLPSPPTDFSEHPGFPNHRRTRLSELNLRRLACIPQGGGMVDLPVELRVNCHKNGADKIGHRYVYGRLDWIRPSATITARFDSFTRGKFAHPIEDRNITLREGARLQTFPDDFVFLGTQESIAAQIGNAVPPLIAAALALQVREAICNRAAGKPALGKAALKCPTLPFQE